MFTTSLVHDIVGGINSDILLSDAERTLSSIPPMQKTALLIDGPNFQKTRKAIKMEKDYQAFFSVLRRYFNLTSIYYFMGLWEGTPSTPMVKELHYLSKSGVRVVTKPATKHISENGEVFYKGNMDTHLCITACLECSTAENIMLASGDSDFIPLLNGIKGRGQRATLLSSEDERVDCLSHALRLCADTFIDLAWINALIKKEEKEIDLHQYLN